MERSQRCGPRRIRVGMRTTVSHSRRGWAALGCSRYGTGLPFVAARSTAPTLELHTQGFRLIRVVLVPDVEGGGAPHLPGKIVCRPEVARLLSGEEMLTHQETSPWPSSTAGLEGLCMTTHRPSGTSASPAPCGTERKPPGCRDVTHRMMTLRQPHRLQGRQGVITQVECLDGRIHHSPMAPPKTRPQP